MILVWKKMTVTEAEKAVADTVPMIEAWFDKNTDKTVCNVQIAGNITSEVPRGVALGQFLMAELKKNRCIMEGDQSNVVPSENPA